MNILLFDHPEIRPSLLPLTYTRPVADIRLGILTIAEKWEKAFNASVGFSTQSYLQPKFPVEVSEDMLYINGALCPDEQLVEVISGLSIGEGIQQNGITLAFRYHQQQSLEAIAQAAGSCIEYQFPITLIRYNWELFLENGDQIRADFQRLTKGRTSQPLTDQHTVVYNPENLFIEEDVSIKAAIINAEGGPVYLGAGAEVQEGTIIQGPFAMCAHSQLRLGGKMRPNTTVGPYCKVGGEVGNVIFQSHSNKAHEGFLGNSVIGSWCNLGADTNNSNLKNNYSNVRCWNYHQQTFVDTGLQFCGVTMGDHSKCAINTMLNTGTVVGVSANIYGPGFPDKFVPSFIWGGTGITKEYDFEKVCQTISKVMGRKAYDFNGTEKDILRTVFDLTFAYRQSIIT
ncbi:MAG: glucose-1-phosphate thymidylyltransferase [Cyclobacteriaceae bacterium]|nr:MAG: glucose-1-phosphate thymidylyltransferase [Cyclobacteriaceae bacterium]